MNIYRLLLLSVALLGASCTTVKGPSLVSQGQPHAEIIIAESPPRMVKLAAEELQTYVERISGATLPIRTTPDPLVPLQIYVGKSAYTENLGIRAEGLENDGYRLVSGDNWLVLIGEDADYVPIEPYARNSGDRPRAAAEWDRLTGARWANPGVSTFKGYNSALGVWANDQRGSLNAVYGFLRMLGVRWYAPGEIGEVLPTISDIPLPLVDRTVRPDVAGRNLMLYADRFFMASREDALWQLRLGLNWRRDTGGHGIDWVTHHDNTRRDHPEYFMMVNGKRDTISRGGKPCLSSPGLIQANVEFARAYFDIYDTEMLSVMPTDAYSNLCQCELCKGKSTPERGYNGQLSDYVWAYVNAVAKEVYKTHPTKKITCYAYSAYQLPPEKIDKLSPNVVVGICQGRANFHNETIRQNFLDLRKAWLGKLSGDQQLTIWEYYLHARQGGAYQGIPVYFPHLISQDMQSLQGILSGEGIEVYTDGNDDPDIAFAIGQLNCYVTARLWWDMDLDVDALLDEFYARFYGPAQTPMKAFVEYAEANWPRMMKEAEPLDRALELIAAAREAAGNESIYARRVAWVSTYLEPIRQLREKLAMGRDQAPMARVFSRHGNSAVTIDGRLDDPFWRDITGYSLREIETGRAPMQPTWFQAAWRGDSLYFAIRCLDSDMAHLTIGATEDGDSSLWDGDTVEILLETQNHAYYQIAISPTGAVMDADRATGINTIWSADAEVAAQRDADGWSVEIRIPVAGELQAEVEPDKFVSGRRPTVTYPWYFNIGRQRKRATGLELSMFSPPGKRNFHVPMKFGKLYMEK